MRDRLNQAVPTMDDRAPSAWAERHLYIMTRAEILALGAEHFSHANIILGNTLFIAQK